VDLAFAMVVRLAQVISTGGVDMAQVVGSRFSRLAMRPAIALGAAGFAAVVVTPAGAPQAAGLSRLQGSGGPGAVSAINTSATEVMRTGGARQRAIRGPSERGSGTTDLS
jgi:hypothetical protein